ncbi:ABC transporter substrate-binding protein [uncultured Psychroserpens sp.]|uniref:ABC transporter substrate-binding protein n=1 Tax=uncultured Psychroserpens sp. TaxID=255436 RepID=UPI002635AF87|nr:helical backbone metal receptor [uncultured Psychroserpens sp.]
MIHRDQLKRLLEFETTPKRIISLVPSQTELLVDLGLEASIVGVTKFCVHPEYLRKEKTIVGGTKAVNMNKIKALKPDIILCNKEENTQEMVSELETIAAVHVSDINNLDDCYELIKMYSALFKIKSKGEQLISVINNERNVFREKFLNRKQCKVAYFIWKNPWMVCANHTFVNVMMTEAGFDNVFKKRERYPEVLLDDPLLNDAEVILLSSEPFPFKEKDKQEFFVKYPNKQVIIIDGELFSWYGSRLKYSYKYFGTIFEKLLTS